MHPDPAAQAIGMRLNTYNSIGVALLGVALPLSMSDGVPFACCTTKIDTQLPKGRIADHRLVVLFLRTDEVGPFKMEFVPPAALRDALQASRQQAVGQQQQHGAIYN